MDCVARASSSRRRAFHVVRDPPDRPHPARAKRGRTAPSRQVPRGRVRRHHPHRLRVSRVPVTRVSTLFPQATPPVYQNAPRSYPERNVRGHPTQTRRVARTRIPSRHQVGVRLGPRRENQRVSPNLFEDLRVGGSPATSGRLFRGRTNTVKLHHEANTKAGEHIKFLDVTSLYPWVNKNGTYPVGHPVILPNPEDLLGDYFGLARVDILPPFELYHPVLPDRQNGKLTIPFCAKCVETEMPKPLLERRRDCSHTPDQRRLRVTWCTPELQKAV